MQACKTNSWVINCWVILICKSYQTQFAHKYSPDQGGNIQWNPDFSNPWFFETFNISNQFLPPMEEIYKKFSFDFSNPHQIFKVLLSSFHMNIHTSQNQKVEPPSITQ